MACWADTAPEKNPTSMMMGSEPDPDELHLVEEQPQAERPPKQPRHRAARAGSRGRRSSRTPGGTARPPLRAARPGPRGDPPPTRPGGGPGALAADEAVLMAGLQPRDGGVAQDTGNPFRDAAQDLVADRPRPTGEVVDRDLPRGRRGRSERHRAADAGGGGRHVGHVDHQHVHADRADDGRAAPADQDLRRPRRAAG